MYPEGPCRSPGQGGVVNDATHEIPTTSITFAEAFRSSLAERNVTLSALQRRLDDRGLSISLATLSYWRAGARQPERRASIEVVEEIEAVLDVSPGSLTEHIRPRSRPGPAGREVPLSHLLRPSERTQAALEALGFGGPPGVREISVHNVLDVDGNGMVSTLTARILYRAIQDVVTSVPIVLTVAERVSESARFEAVAGGSIGRTSLDLAHSVFVAELTFERPLTAGESVFAEHRIHLPVSEIPNESYEYNLVRRIREVMIWVRFDPRRMPERVTTYTVFDDDAEDTEWLDDSALDDLRIEQPVDISEVATVHTAVHGRGPGKVGIRWFWPTADSEAAVDRGLESTRTD